MKKALQRSLKTPDAILSMLIGFAVIITVGFALFKVIQTTTLQKLAELTKPATDETKITLPAVHTTKDGENLWVISETYYKTGYNWVDIAEENKLENPDLIYPEQKLTIPAVSPRTPEGELVPAAATVKAKHTSYTIVEGDTLWDIAMKEYNDNYRWPDIASFNNIPNPDLIFPSVILQLP